MTRSPLWLHSLLIGVVAAGTALSTGACASDKVDDIVRPDLDTLFWSLNVNAKAVTVAVGEQQQLIATPQTINGTALTGFPKPVWTSSDPTRVTVDSTGLLTGVAETQGISVIATLTAQGITYVDTVPVAVTTQRAVVSRLEFSVFGPQSIALGGYGATTFMVSAVDAEGNEIPGVAIATSLVENGIATLYAYGGPAQIQASGLGQVHVVATTTSYGTTVVDTAVFPIYYTTNGNVQISSNGLPGSVAQFYPTSLVIGVGGSVTWNNYNSTPVHITFTSGGDQVDGGDVGDIEPNGAVTRTFPTVGTYSYKDTIAGQTGTVFVRNQPTY
jgi:plastocyanin